MSFLETLQVIDSMAGLLTRRQASNAFPVSLFRTSGQCSAIFAGHTMRISMTARVRQGCNLVDNSQQRDCSGFSPDSLLIAGSGEPMRRKFNIFFNPLQNFTTFNAAKPPAKCISPQKTATSEKEACRALKHVMQHIMPVCGNNHGLQLVMTIHKR